MFQFPNAMTPEEAQAEWRYRVEERLGMLCGAGEPTAEQRALAVREANEALIELDSANSRYETNIEVVSVL